MAPTSVADELATAEEEMRQYLVQYGYSVEEDATLWSNRGSNQGPGPALELSLTGHEEREGHTWYILECSLAASGSRILSWSASRRLVQLREQLHKHIRAELGNRYDTCFAGTPFALKGGLRGTSGRLKTWFAALAAGINSGALPPIVAWLTLKFLEAPKPPTLSSHARATASSAADKLRGAFGAAAGAVRSEIDKAKEDAGKTAASFVSSNPKAAKAASDLGLGYAKQNPQAVQAGAKVAFGCFGRNPAAAMSVMKATARAASATF